MPVSVDTLYTAVTVFKEARGESRQCQVLVAEVVRNRMDDKGMTAQQVVKERGQFSWMPLMRGTPIRAEYDRLKIHSNEKERKALSNAVLIAQEVLSPKYDTGNNLFYFHSRKGHRYDVKCGNLYFSHRHK